MKRSLAAAWVAVLVFASRSGLGAQAVDVPALSEEMALYVQLDLMAESRLFTTPEGIADMRRYSVGLSDQYRSRLYQDYRRSPWLPALLNAATGGVGSIVTGDVLPGVLLEVGLGVAFGIVALPWLVEDAPSIETLSIAAAAIGITVTVTGVVLPFISTARWNKKLSSALSYEVP